MPKYYLLLLPVLILFSFCNSCSSDMQSGGNNPPTSDTNRIVLSNLNYPWEILWGQDNHIWMPERRGKISKIKPATGAIVLSATI